MKEEDKNYFKILVITDIHDRIYNASKVIDLNKNQKFDFVLCCGDIVTVPGEKNREKDIIAPYIPLLQNILIELEKIAPVYWVPGNHEPYIYYNTDCEEASSNSKNIHKKFQKLANDLYLVGLGGTVPILTTGKWSKDDIPFKDIDKAKILYQGFPYNVSDNFEESDNELYKDLSETINKAKNDGGKDIQMILLSHLGPFFTSTNYQEEDGDMLYLGSKRLGEKLEEESNILINIHGHTHLSGGFITLRPNRYLFNPGANYEGKYGTLEIKKNSEGKWIIGSFSIDYL